MHLILVRHAEKQSAGGTDPGLSERGLHQAQALIRELQDKRWPAPDQIVSSPKNRAQMTISPIAQHLGKKLIVSEDLDEKQPGETTAQFRLRLRRTLSSLDDVPQQCVVWCTHLDWIEEFRDLADCESNLFEGPFNTWAPAQYLVLKLDDLWSVVAFGNAP